MPSAFSYRGPPAASLPSHQQPCGHRAGEAELAQAHIEPRKVGKYLVSPLIKDQGDGWFASSVSIRSGSGSGTSDRVLRLTRLFRRAADAADFAHTEALRWIGASLRPAAA